MFFAFNYHIFALLDRKLLQWAMANVNMNPPGNMNLSIVDKNTWI